MKAHLMYAGRDFAMTSQLPANEADLNRDLGLGTVLAAMAGDDEFLLGVARQALLTSLTSPGEISYRQQVLADCLRRPAVIRQMYAISAMAVDGERKIYRGFFSDYPDSTMHRSVEAMQLYVGLLKQLRAVADEHAAAFRSPGFSTFFGMLATELSDEYFAAVDDHLRQLKFRNGVLVSARLGKGAKGTSYVLRQPGRSRQSLLGRIPAASYTLRISDRDEGGLRTLAELRGRGLNLAANALAQSADHILSFFRVLRTELGFYLGCLNVTQQLSGKSEPLCVPVVRAAAERVLQFRGLYDAGLSLRLPGRAVGNDMDSSSRSLVLITGANQGGKSTFLRSAGLAMLMMQCGMLVPAESFTASVCDRVFTHFKRPEDATMRSGKLDEELSRMSAIADQLTARSMVLFNEPFAATNEREGSEIARQILSALLESGVRVFLVTHLFDLASSLYRRQGTGSATFLRAERGTGGRRTFRLAEGAPQPTSYGPDVYERVFGAPLHR